MMTSTKTSKISKRPLAGIICSFLGGAIILYFPLHFYWLAFVPQAFVFPGIVIGGLLLTCTVLAWFYPTHSRIFGIFIMVLSIASLVGALGGLFVGMILGMIGGSLLFAWRPISPEQLIAEAEKGKRLQEVAATREDEA